jgi:hypothetical protein
MSILKTEFSVVGKSEAKIWGDVLALQVIAGQLSPRVRGPLFPVVSKPPWELRLRQGRPRAKFTASLWPAARRPALRCCDECSDSAPFVARLSKPWTRGIKDTRWRWCGKAKLRSANNAVVTVEKPRQGRSVFPHQNRRWGERLDPSTGWKPVPHENRRCQRRLCGSQSLRADQATVQMTVRKV